RYELADRGDVPLAVVFGVRRVQAKCLSVASVARQPLVAAVAFQGRRRLIERYQVTEVVCSFSGKAERLREPNRHFRRQVAAPLAHELEVVGGCGTDTFREAAIGEAVF